MPSPRTSARRNKRFSSLTIRASAFWEASLSRLFDGFYYIIAKLSAPKRTPKSYGPTARLRTEGKRVGLTPLVSRRGRRRIYPKVLPRRSAGVISRDTGFADVRSPIVDRARRRDAALSDKGRAAVAVASHASPRVIDKRAGNPTDVGFAFQRKPRPLRGKGAACATALARGRTKLGLICVVVHLILSLTADSLPRL